MMRKDSLLILALAACAGAASMLYFLSLAAQVPFSIAALIIGAACTLLLRSMRTLHYPSPAYTWLTVAALAVGLFLITNRTYYLASRWGDWDAWGMWNYHARFLADGNSWANLFKSVQYDHPDYPLGLPALLAFVERLCRGRGALHISFALHFIITLSIPLLVFLLLQKKNLVVAAAALLLFATDEFYLQRGVSQYADTALAGYFLLALIAIRYESDVRMIAASAFFAGCAAWTKNEGIVLAFLLVLLYANVFFSKKAWRYTLAGAALPLLTILLFKTAYAPANDLLQNSNGGLIQQLKDVHRYKLVWTHFKDIVSAHFLSTGIAVLIYALACLVRKRRPDKGFVLLLICLGAYLATYILTPYDPQWHLQTSMNRLLHQLMPATIYVIALRLCDLWPLQICAYEGSQP